MPNGDVYYIGALYIDILSMGKWVNCAQLSSGYQVDDPAKCMSEIDRFFDEQNKSGGILSENIGQILFALGALIGKTAIRQYSGFSTLWT